MPVNKQFFMDHMVHRRMSLREVAKQMDVWPAALSRSLDGKRKMQLPEAVRLSQVLHIPLTEVLTNAGIEAAKAAGRRCDIIGHLNGEGFILPTPKDTIERTPIPDGAPDNVQAIQSHTSDSPYSFSDGWLTFVTEKRPPSDLLGHFSMVELDDGRCLLATLRRGYEPGTFNLFGPIKEPFKSARVNWARKCIMTVY